MIKWTKIEAGEYESEDKRFHIEKTWNRIYGNHWELLDREEPDHYKGIYNEESLIAAKLKAEMLMDIKK